MVVLMGDDDEQHHASIQDYDKNSKPRILFNLLNKVKPARLIDQFRHHHCPQGLLLRNRRDHLLVQKLSVCIFGSLTVHHHKCPLQTML